MGNRIHILHACVCVHAYVIPRKNYFTIQELCFFGKSTLLEADSPCPVFLDMFTSLSLGFFIWSVCMIRLQINQYSSWFSAIFNSVLYDDIMISLWSISARLLGLLVTFSCARRWTWTHFRKNRLTCSGVSSGFLNCQSIPVQQDVPGKYNFGTSPFSSR